MIAEGPPGHIWLIQEIFTNVISVSSSLAAAGFFYVRTWEGLQQSADELRILVGTVWFPPTIFTRAQNTDK